MFLNENLFSCCCIIYISRKFAKTWVPLKITPRSHKREEISREGSNSSSTWIFGECLG